MATLSNQNVSDILLMVDMLYQPVDSAQSGVADRWLQEWQTSDNVWSICIQVCQRNEKQYYSIFMLNTINNYLHRSFHSLSPEIQSTLLSDLFSLVNIIGNDPVLSRLLATAFCVASLLIVDNSHVITNLANSFISLNVPLLFVHFIGQLPLECQDSRFSSLSYYAEFNIQRLQSLGSSVVSYFVSVVDSNSFLPDSLVTPLLEGIHAWISIRAISLSALLHFPSLLKFLFTQLQSENNCTEAATAITDVLQGPKEDSELTLIASQWIENMDGSLMQSVDYTTSIYHFTDLPEKPLASAWLQIACTLAEEGASLYCSQPDGVMNTVWTCILQLFAIPDHSLVTLTIDFLEGFLIKENIPKSISHPLFTHLSTLRDILLRYLVIPSNSIDESMSDSVQSMRRHLGYSLVQLSHILDEEDTLYEIVAAAEQDLQQNNVVHLDGMLYALGWLCRDMSYLENEELVQLLFSTNQILQCSVAAHSMFFLIRCLAHAIATSPSLFQSVLQAVTSQFTSYPKAASDAFDVLCAQGASIHSLQELFCQLLSMDIGTLPSKAIPGFLKGCCALAQPLEDICNSWFIAQLHAICNISDLEGLKVLLSHTQSMFPTPSLDLVNELKGVLNQLCCSGATIKTENVLETWKECVSLLLRILVRHDPGSLYILSQMLVEAVQSENSPIHVTLLGEILVSGGTVGSLQPWMQQSLHQVVQHVVFNADKENGFSESAASLTALYTALHDCLRVCGNLVVSLPSLRCVVETAAAAIASFHRELRTAACSFLEVLVIYDAQNDNPVLRAVLEANASVIMKECLNCAVEQNAYHLVYETSRTPLSLLFSFYEYHRESLLGLLNVYYSRIDENSEWTERIEKLRSDKDITIYGFNESILCFCSLLRLFS